MDVIVVMSSDSDPEEFFDAQDDTPVQERIQQQQQLTSVAKTRSVTKVDKPRLDDIQSVPVLDLDEEERRILEMRKLADERRLKEEKEIEKRLAEIERRKAESAERKKNEDRRSKLEALRNAVDCNGGATTSRLPTTKPAHLNTSSPDINFVGCYGDDDDRAPDVSRTSSLQKRSSEAEDAGSPCSRSTTTLVKPASASDVSSERNRAPPPPSGSFMDVNDTINRNRPPNIDVEKAPRKNIPQVIVRGVSSDGESSSANVVLRSGRPCSFEPDIVQSTKTGSLNRFGQMAPSRPVAPPRKKKGQSTGATNDASPSRENRDSFGLSLTEDGKKMTDAISLTKELENSFGIPCTDDGSEPVLDIRSATKGDRVVTVFEESSAKGYSEEDDASGTSDKTDVGKVEETTADKEIENAMMKLTLGITGNGKNGEEYSIPLSMSRPRSGSGSRYLTDKEILDQVFVLNLDTGETVPLGSAEEKLPKCINPLSLHIMRRTKEYSSDSNLYKGDHSDDDSSKGTSGRRTVKTVKPLRKRKLKLKKFFKTKIKDKIKSVKGGHGDGSSSEDDEASDGRSMIKVKASHSHKGPYDFDMLVPIQDLAGQSSGAVWTMKFSHCGRLLATGGQDNLLRVWVLKDAFSYFNDMRQKYNEASATKVSPAHSEDSLNSQQEGTSSDPKPEGTGGAGDDADDAEYLPFIKRPFCIYRGHTADLLDVSWSKNYFILSSSMDKTVRLWHISRRECLCCFQHIDFVTAIAFHPRDDRYFLSGSLDGKLRLWNIPDKKVALWNEVSSGTKLITAANFCLNGRFAVVGTYDGRCVFYTTEQLKYFTQIHVRSTRGKNARGRKITGVEPFPDEDKILVTSNDSRIRLYDLRDLTLTCKYKGCANNSSQIKASFSHDGKYIICGSEDHYVYIWKTQHDFYKFSSARRDRSDFWEGIKAHSAVVTNAIFAPNPLLIIKPQFQFVDTDDRENTEGTSGQGGEVLVSADYSGAIKIFINKFKPS